MTITSPAPAESVFATSVAWVRTVSALAFLCVYVLVIGPPALAATYLTGRGSLLIPLGVYAAKTTRRLLGIRYSVEGYDHVQATRPAVYCFNHRSNVDLLVFEVLFPRCPRLRALFKAEMTRLPILGVVFQRAGFEPVERGHRERAMEAVDQAVSQLLAGDSFLLAPEGTRSPTGALLPFKKGAFVMAIRAQVPIVPVALDGTAGAMPKGRSLVRPARVTVRIGAPIETRGLALENREALASQVRMALEQLLST
jgi:1-acyl-sn-glycerol-3-phosphate acyltransferase